jgi:hypothetical protein
LSIQALTIKELIDHKFSRNIGLISEANQAKPYYTQLDLYRSKFRNGYLLWGWKNPLQRLKRHIILKKFKEALDQK